MLRLTSDQLFAIEMLEQCGTGNVFISPFSIRAAMGRPMVGARGQTREQMENILRLGGTDGDVMIYLHSEENLIEDLRGVTFKVANRIYAQQGYGFDPKFLRRMAQLASFEGVDFEHEYEQVRHMINAWVQDQTDDKINNLLGRGTLDDKTRFVIINAVYFLGNWASQFAKGLTHTSGFRTPSRLVMSDFMTQEESFLYAENDMAQALVMPYEGNQLGMLTILPKDGKSFDLREAWSDLVAKMGRQKVKVYYPKFEVKWGTKNLAEAFQEMGMVEAFSQDADFSGITGDYSLAIDGVYHQTYVKVNEAGTEAAAATAVVMLEKGLSMPEPVPVFRADHPFFYSIVTLGRRDGHNPLFIGRMEDPTK